MIIECLVAALPKVVATEHSKMASETEELHFLILSLNINSYTHVASSYCVGNNNSEVCGKV